MISRGSLPRAFARVFCALWPRCVATRLQRACPTPNAACSVAQALQSQWLGGGLAETSITTDLAEEVEGRARITDAQPRRLSLPHPYPHPHTHPGSSSRQ